MYERREIDFVTFKYGSLGKRKAYIVNSYVCKYRESIVYYLIMVVDKVTQQENERVCCYFLICLYRYKKNTTFEL